MGEEIENPFWWTDSGINMDRIENIKKQIEDDRTAALIGAGNNIFISRTDIEWLIDEIKRMEEKWELEQQSADAYFVKLLSAKKALEFYADEINYNCIDHGKPANKSCLEWIPIIALDRGDTAHKVLGEIE